MKDKLLSVRKAPRFEIDLRIRRVAKPGKEPSTTKEKVREDVEAANVIWRDAGFSFRAERVSTWESERFWKIDSYEEFTDGLESAHWNRRQAFINVYYVKKVIAGSVTGICSFPPQVPGGPFNGVHAIAIDNRATDLTLAHEFGHYFGLHHPHSDFEDLADTAAGEPFKTDPNNIMSYRRRPKKYASSDMHLTGGQIALARATCLSHRSNLVSPMLAAHLG